MNSRSIFSLGVSALVLGGTMVGCTATHGMLASAGTSEAKSAKQAAQYVDKAGKMLAKNKLDKAVDYAEQAVAYAPKDAANRALLGQVYLKAGRFVSATQALRDALVLDPANGQAALNLALAQTATGDWSGARQTLDLHQNTISAGDRGLALALAGDPDSAVQILSEVARGATANATARQNLALALALSGRWAEAKSVASIDVAPGELNDRIMEWAEFAKPQSASDQVAALLGVTPVADSGQPVRLALKDSDTQMAAGSAVAPDDAADSYLPAPAQDSEADAALADAMEAPTPAPSNVASLPANEGPAISFAPRQEIVQQLPANYASAAPVSVPARQAKTVAKAESKPAAASTLAQGNYYVQLGAYRNEAVARDAWGRMKSRNAHIAAHDPSGMNVTVRGRNFYRLSVGGFARNDAQQLCAQVKASGGKCFVRADAGDKVASWTRKSNTQFASR